MTTTAKTRLRWSRRKLLDVTSLVALITESLVNRKRAPPTPAIYITMYKYHIIYCIIYFNAALHTQDADTFNFLQTIFFFNSNPR